MNNVALFTAASLCALAIGSAGCSDDEDGGGGGAGTAGTGGTAGSAGAAGSNGSGGTAGSAGSAGSGGMAGTSGSGGSGGSSGGGSGGSSGTTGDRCSGCLEQRCAAPVAACEANADCGAIYDCVIIGTCGEIPEPLVCIEECSTDHAAGRPIFEPLVDCILDTCGQECSGS